MNENGNWLMNSNMVKPEKFSLSLYSTFKESTCETKKNTFYFTLKAIFVLEIIKF